MRATLACGWQERHAAACCHLRSSSGAPTWVWTPTACGGREHKQKNRVPLEIKESHLPRGGRCDPLITRAQNLIWYSRRRSRWINRTGIAWCGHTYNLFLPIFGILTTDQSPRDTFYSMTELDSYNHLSFCYNEFSIIYLGHYLI